MTDTLTPLQAVAEELGLAIEQPMRRDGDHWTSNPSALTIGAYTYNTIDIAGVKVALSTTDIYIHKGSVYYADPTERMTDALVVAAVVVPPSERRKGLAALAMKELCAAASRVGIVLKLEPCPITSQRVKGERLPTASQLRKFYARFGFVGGQIMERQP